MNHDPAPHEARPAAGPAPAPRTAEGWLTPSADWLRRLLDRPELALVEESCAAEITLHAALVDAPLRPVDDTALTELQDADARDNYAAFLTFRDSLVAAGSLEAWYLAQMRSGRVTTPPAFIDHVVEAIAAALTADSDDAFEARAAALLYRPQRVALVDGRQLSADLAVVDMLDQTAGLGDLGRLLRQANAPLRPIELQVLSADNAVGYWQGGRPHEWVLDLTHAISNELGHGLSFQMVNRHSGLRALARGLERWVAHLLGVQVTIEPLQRIDDPAWRWHIGLDVPSMALLNDLYEERPVEPERLAQLVSLFRLDFANAGDMRPDIAGRPIYLGLATTPDGILRLKPQNLLLNLPLASSS